MTDWNKVFLRYNREIVAKREHGSQDALAHGLIALGVGLLNSMAARRTIQDTILTLDGLDGHRYGLVSYSDGGYGISCDGSALHESYFPAREIDECTVTLLKLAGRTPTGLPIHHTSSELDPPSDSK